MSQDALSIVSLPVELILDIVHLLPKVDLERLVYACRSLRQLVGPLVYRTQTVSHIHHLIRIQQLSEQRQISHMIKYLDIDTTGIQYWWPGVSHTIQDILFNLTSVESFRLRLSHPLSARLSQAIAYLPALHTFRLHLTHAPLGRNICAVRNLRHIELELTPSSTPTMQFVFDDLVGFIAGSQRTLESLSLSCTDAVVQRLSPDGPLQRLLQRSPHLKRLSLHLEVDVDVRHTLTTIDALEGLPVSSLHLKCRPAMFPTPPTGGYGMGSEVIQRICERLPLLQHLILQDGEVGRANLLELADGRTLTSHFTPLRRLKHLQSVEFPLLLDDVVSYDPPADPSLDAPTYENDKPADVPPATLNPRIEFENHVNDILIRAIHSTLFTSTVRNSRHPGDELEYPLPNLASFNFRLCPTPQMARDLRGMRIYLPSMQWNRWVTWNTATPRVTQVP